MEVTEPVVDTTEQQTEDVFHVFEEMLTAWRKQAAVLLVTQGDALIVSFEDVDTFVDVFMRLQDKGARLQVLSQDNMTSILLLDYNIVLQIACTECAQKQLAVEKEDNPG